MNNISLSIASVTMGESDAHNARDDGEIADSSHQDIYAVK
jgi:hypothetical protein